MKSFYEALKKHIEANPPSYGDCDARSILEMLWNCYCQHNQMDTDQIKEGFAELYRHMQNIPIPDMDGVIDTVCTLCWEHERAGFVEGVKVGSVGAGVNRLKYAFVANSDLFIEACPIRTSSVAHKTKSGKTPPGPPSQACSQGVFLINITTILHHLGLGLYTHWVG